MKFFNTEGPIKPELHYYIPVAQRIDLDEIKALIERQKYFVLHAPRQSGKTTALLEIMRQLNASGHYKCLYVNVERAQVARERIEEAMDAIVKALTHSEKINLGEQVIAGLAHAALDKGKLSALHDVLGKILRNTCGTKIQILL